MIAWLLTSLILLLPGFLYAQSAPYPASDTIDSISWDCGGEVTGANGSDLFPSTWHDDGHIYLAWGDGFCGFAVCGNKSSVGISRLTGTPTSIGDQDVLCDDSGDCLTSPSSNGINPNSWSNGSGGGKILGILSLGGTIYGWHSDQDGSFPQNVTYRLVWSDDDGRHWSQDNETFPSGGTSFSPRSFVQHGQGTAAPDGYVYFTGHNKWSDIDDLKSVYMGRVLAANIKNKTSYEYFSGTPSSPAWSSSIGSRASIFTDASHVNRTVNISYNAGIGKYMLIASHWVGSQNDQDIGVFESDNPWGPWFTAYYETGTWCGYTGQLTLGWSIPTKTPDWLSTDGLTFHTIWSGANSSTLDKYHQIKGTITLAAGGGGDMYFADDGSDGNPCTEAEPCQTQAKMETEWAGMSGGDRLFFKCGDTFRFDSTFDSKASGSSGSPITLTQYGTCTGDNDPILTAFELLTGWVLNSGSVWRKDNIDTETSRNVWFDHVPGKWIEVTEGAGYSCPGDLDEDLEFCIGGSGNNDLYVYSEGGDPDTRFTNPGVEGNDRSPIALLEIDDQWITVNGLQILGGVNTIEVRNGGGNVVIKNSTIGHSYLPDGSGYSPSETGGWTIEFEAIIGNITLEDNEIRYAGRDHLDVNQAYPTGDTIIRRNIFRDAYNHGAMNLSKDQPSGLYTGLMLVERNEIYNTCGGVAFGSGDNGGQDNLIIRYNYIHDLLTSSSPLINPVTNACGSTTSAINQNGIDIASNYTVSHNIIYNNDRGANVDGPVDMNFNNNTLDLNADPAIVPGGSSTANWTITDNFVVDSGSGSPYLLDSGGDNIDFISVVRNYWFDSSQSNNDILEHNSTTYTLSEAVAAFPEWDNTNVQSLFGTSPALLVDGGCEDYNVKTGSPALAIATGAREAGALKAPMFQDASITEEADTIVSVTLDVFDAFEPISSCDASKITIRCDSVIQTISSCAIASTSVLDIELASSTAGCSMVTMEFAYGAFEDSAKIGNRLNSRNRPSTANEHGCSGGLCPVSMDFTAPSSAAMFNLGTTSGGQYR